MPARPPEMLRVPTAPHPHRAAQLGLLAAVALAIVVRGVHVLSSGFPLNDGALFYAMTRDIQQANYSLPAFTSYNSGDIPFGYSPLGFYLAAAVNEATRIPLIELFRWLPLVATSLTVVALALLARDMLRDRWAVVAAVVAFALIPRSFLWMLMGGGLTRSLGFLFAILAIRQVYRLYTRQRWSHAALATLFAALTVLSHLGTAPFVAFSSALLFVAYGRHRHGVLASAAVAVGTVLLTAPWWSTVIGVHGLAPFVAALSTGGTIFSSDILNRAVGALGYFGLGTGEPILSLIGMLAVVGALASFGRRRYFLPAWWVATVVLDQRAGSTYATLAVSMLAGIAVVEVLLPLLTRSRAAAAGEPRGVPAVGTAQPRGLGLPVAVLGSLCAFAIFSALFRFPEIRGEGRDLRSLSAEERAAMRWVAQTTPAASRFLVIGQTPWEVDRSGEWFPVLAGRVSAANAAAQAACAHRWRV